MGADKCVRINRDGDSKVIKEWKGFACYDSFTSLLGVHMMCTRL